jgi:hypothetical protein
LHLGLAQALGRQHRAGQEHAGHRASTGFQLHVVFQEIAGFGALQAEYLRDFLDFLVGRDLRGGEHQGVRRHDQLALQDLVREPHHEFAVLLIGLGRIIGF